MADSTGPALLDPQFWRMPLEDRMADAMGIPLVGGIKHVPMRSTPTAPLLLASEERTSC